MIRSIVLKTWKALHEEEVMQFQYPGDTNISAHVHQTDYEPLMLEVRDIDLTVSQSNKRFNSVGQDGTTPSSQPASKSKKRKYHASDKCLKYIIIQLLIDNCSFQGVPYLS